MKWDRIGFIYLGVGIICALIFIPLAYILLIPINDYIAQLLEFIISQFMANKPTTDLGVFTRAFMFSLTGGLLVFLPTAIGIQNWQMKKAKEKRDLDTGKQQESQNL